MSFSIIAAVGKDREIGKNNQLIWHLPGDLKFFKTTTIGHPVLMGRKTFESLPRLLPGRDHYVVSRNIEAFAKAKLEKGDNSDVKVIRVSDLDEFALQHRGDIDEIFVIGGATIYDAMLKYADKIYLTEIDASDPGADAFFPEFDQKKFKKQILGQGEDNGVKYTFSCYKLK